MFRHAPPTWWNWSRYRFAPVQTFQVTRTFCPASCLRTGLAGVDITLAFGVANLLALHALALAPVIAWTRKSDLTAAFSGLTRRLVADEGEEKVQALVAIRHPTL